MASYRGRRRGRCAGCSMPARCAARAGLKLWFSAPAASLAVTLPMAYLLMQQEDVRDRFPRLALPLTGYPAQQE